jgi:hypothetical protein
VWFRDKRGGAGRGSVFGEGAVVSDVQRNRGQSSRVRSRPILSLAAAPQSIPS